MPEIKRPRSLTSIVTEHIRDMIVYGDVPLGSALSERGIAAELKVSKTPVREALAQLRNEGLVSIMPQSGVQVFTLSAREVREICVFRRALEIPALDLAMANEPDALLVELDAIVRQMEKAMARQDTRGYLALDTQFHLAFFNHCGNGYLRSAYSQFSAKISALRTHLAQKPQHTAMSLKEHHEIVEAVRDGDMAHVSDVLNRHIGRTQETYEITVEDIAQADQMKPG